MNTSKSFTDLIVWQRAHQFTLKTYQFTSKFPKEEMYGLISQFRRAAVSVAANITEGYAKKGLADKKRFLNIAQGSIQECKYYLLLASDLKFNQDREMNELAEEVSKLLFAYMRGIDRRSAPDS